MTPTKPICPICKTAETVPETTPFCSKRCADVDLHHWLGGQYAIPAVEPPDEWDMQAQLKELKEAEEAEDDKSDLH